MFQDRICRFGKVVNGQMVLNELGKIAEACWLQIPEHFTNVILHDFVIMPNHVHGIVEIVGAKHRSPDAMVGAKHLSPEVPVDSIHKQSNTPEEPEDLREKDVSPEKNRAKEIPQRDLRTKDISPIDLRAKDVSPQRGSEINGTSKTLGSIVRGFKIGVTKWVRQNTQIHDLWQRDYYEHIIRDERAYLNISQYIQNNPLNWGEDKFHH